MQGHIPQSLWDSVKDTFIVLPEDGWAKNFCAFVQNERKWTLERANSFVKWVKAPAPDINVNTLNYMREQVEAFEIWEKSQP